MSHAPTRIRPFVLAFVLLFAGTAPLAAEEYREAPDAVHHRWTDPFVFLGPGRTMQDDPVDVPTIRVGLLGSFTGTGGAYGREMEKGVRLMVDEINGAGGIFGKPVEIVKGDDHNDMGINGHETVRLIDEGIWAMIGSVHSGCTHVATRITLKCEVVQLTSISTDPTIGLVGSPWMFRCLVDDRGQGRALAELMFDQLRLKRVCLVRHNNRYGKMGGKEISDIARRRGTPLIFTEVFDTDQQDFSTTVARIRKERPDGVVIWGLYNEAAALVRQLGQAGVKTQILGSDGVVAAEFLELAGPAAEGMLVTYPYDHTSRHPENLAFIAAFERRHGHAPDSFAAHGYDAMGIIARAIREGGLNRYRIRDAMSRIRNYPGATGEISFDHQGNDTRGVIFARVRQGAFVPLARGARP